MYVLFQDNLYNSDDLKYVILKKSIKYYPGSTSLWMVYADSERNYKHYQVIKSVLCYFITSCTWILCHFFPRMGNERCIS